MSVNIEAVNIEAILDQKFDESYRFLAKEKKNNMIFGNIGISVLLLTIVVFIALVRYMFWGAGFSLFSPAHHDYTISALTTLPGPQQVLVQQAMEDRGYLSLVEYKTYVDMANTHKALLDGQSVIH